VIPAAASSIHDKAFDGCLNLTNVMFCDIIEECVSAESMRDWWSQGVHEKSLTTYCFLVRCSIPEHLGLVLLRSLKANIHKLLKRIPSISPEGSDAYFASINSKLTDYENMSEAPMLLELAIWKSKITQQLGHSNDPHPTDTRKRKRIDSVSMVTIIVPNILFSL
jgi:hypothetical protein